MDRFTASTETGERAGTARRGSTTLRSAALLCAAAALGASLAFAGGVDRSSGTVGTTFTITPGETTFPEGKPKVTLENASGKPLKLKVIEAATDHVTVGVGKVREGTFDVVVRHKKQPEFVCAEAFTIVRGTIETVSPDAPAPKTEITITGSDFGSKKGKVKVGGKPAKVKSWTDTSITAQLHKKTPAGSQSLLVSNKVGDADFAAGTITIGGDGGGGSPRLYVRGTFDRDRFQAVDDEVVIHGQGNGFTISATTAVQGADATVFVDLSNATFSQGTSQATPVVMRYAKSGTTWSSVGDPSAIDATIRVNGSRVTITLGGDLPRVEGSGSPDSLRIKGIDVSFEIS